MSDDVYIDLFGAVIYQQIKDYQLFGKYKSKKKKLNSYEENCYHIAKTYLFSSMGLEWELREMLLDDVISISSLRRKINKYDLTRNRSEQTPTKSIEIREALDEIQKNDINVINGGG